MHPPRIKPANTRSSVRSLRLLSLCILAGAVVPMALRASPPAWWATGGVTNGSPANDFAAINQGQLKNLAKAAAVELDLNLPGGAGDEVHNLVNSWAVHSASTNDYGAVNLGQLKSVAKPFYNTLITAGYTTQYPWTGSGSSANDYAAANIGQAKNLFSFSVAAGVTGGLPGWWTTHYGLSGNINPLAEAANSGMTYLRKYQLGLNPTVASTTGDLFTDGWKVNHNLNPHHRMLADTAGTTLALHVYTPLK